MIKNDEEDNLIPRQNGISTEEESNIKTPSLSTEIVQKKTFQSYIDEIGFTYIHTLIIVACSAIYFSEGSEMISFTVLIPVLEKIFSSSNKYLLSMITSIIYIGFLIGTFFVGKMTKNFQRKTGILISLASIAFFGIIIVIFQNLYVFLVCRFSIGFFIGILIPQVLSNLFEILPTDHYKEILVFCVFIFGRLGYVYFLSVYQFVQSNWRVSFILAVFPVLAALCIAFCFFKDSLRLLFNKGQIELLTKEINSFNQIRNIPQLTQHEVLMLKEENEEFVNKSKDQNDFSYLMLFQPMYLHSTILFIIIISFSSMVSFTNIYTLPIIFSTDNKQFHISNMIITQLVTIPAVILAAFTSKFLGRKNSMLFGLSCCFFFSLLPLINNKYLIIASSLINFFIMFALCPVRLFVMEVYPTKLRDISLAVVFAFAKVGDALTPFISDFSMSYMLINGPYLQMGFLCFSALISVMLISYESENKIVQ